MAHLLRCPHCQSPVELGERVVTCASGHCFDVARQGYVNLLPRTPATGAGDTSAMVAARGAFLGRGHFEPFAQALCEVVTELSSTGTGREATGPSESRQGRWGVAELGAGTGYYLARVVERCGAGFGLATDVSVPAVRRAARAHPRVGAVVADSWGVLPVADGAVDVVLDVFAPRSATEMARILSPGGYLVVLTPALDHLAELVGPWGLVRVDVRKAERMASALGQLFDPVSTRSVRWSVGLDRQDVAAVVAMGPSARHLGAGDVDDLLRHMPDLVQVTFSGTVSVLRRSEPGR